MPDPDNFTPREQRFIEALRQAALSNYPNPGRVGCPDQKTLEAVARRQVPMMDPVIDHVWQCSPCAQDVLRYRESLAKRHKWVTPAAIAAVLLLVLAGVVFWQRSKPEEPAVVQNPPTPSARTLARVDLRPFGATRGTDRGRGTEPAVRRDQLTLEVYLPPGSEEGRYELRIMNSDLQTVLGKTVEAALRHQVVTITTDADLRQLQPGRYTLALRPVGEDWSTYPITVE